MCSNNKALTLLEVVAAIAILATLLVAVLAAHDRLARQTKRGELRLAAIDTADTLLATWTSTSPMQIPATRGETDSSPKLYWQVTAVPNPQLLEYGVQVARLRVSDVESIHDTRHPPLAAVEFLTTAALPGEAHR